MINIPFKYKNINHAENYNVYTIVHYFSALYHMLVSEFKSFFLIYYYQKIVYMQKKKILKK